MSLIVSFALHIKAAPVVAPERLEQKSAPTDSRPVKSQTPQDPVASKQARQQPKPSPPTSGSRMKVQAANLDGPTVPHVKNLNDTPTPVVGRPQMAVLSSTAIGIITQDGAGSAPMQQISPSPSVSGTSSRRNNKRKKKVRYLYCLSYSGALTSYHINRHRRRGIRQQKQAPHRKVYCQSRARSRNLPLCNVTQ